jgi:uncharacterized protein (DUF2237 family)
MPVTLVASRHRFKPRRRGRCGARLAHGPIHHTLMRMDSSPARNVLGGPLRPCSLDPVTGFFRNGCCDTCEEDAGSHTVCVEMSAEFLAFSQAAGNDLSTPRPEFGFPGLQPGDRWCVCAARWLQAYRAGFAAPVVLVATHEAALEIVPLEALKAHATA